MASEAPTIRLVNQVIGNGRRAEKLPTSTLSDGRLSSSADIASDGSLRTAQRLPLGCAPQSRRASRIMSKLDIAERSPPTGWPYQDRDPGVDIDFSRLHHPDRIRRERSHALFSTAHVVALDFVKARLHETHIAVSEGASGSTEWHHPGHRSYRQRKTRKLYTGSRSQREDSKIFTVEDPIEYQLNSINQVQVQPAVGFDFPQRVALNPAARPRHHHDRRDPGLETPVSPSRPLLTGHLVFTTPHQ